MDSPVSAASCMRRPCTAVKRRSAGTTCPASSTTVSPGTTSRAAMSCSLPSRRTCACGAAIRCRASSAFSARYSCTTPITALMSTMARMMYASDRSPTAPATTAAASSTRIIRSLNCPRKMPRMVRLRLPSSSLGPCSRSRSAASAADSPSPSAPSARRTSSMGCWCQCMTAAQRCGRHEDRDRTGVMGMPGYEAPARPRIGGSPGQCPAHLPGTPPG